MPKTKVLQDDEDFLVEVVEYNNGLAVKKSVKETTREERRARLQNEVYGLRYFKTLANENKQLNLYIPQLYEAAEDYIITEYIAGHAIGNNAEALEQLADLLAKIDRIEPNGQEHVVPNFDYRNIRDRFDVWVPQAMENGLVSENQINKINILLDKLSSYLRPRIAHGDLSPYDHVIVQPSGQLAFVDLEVFTPKAARYYDAARCYTRLWQKSPSAQVPKRFLKQFMEFSGQVDHKEEQLLAILAQRTVGMLRDAVVDAKKGENYKDRATQLLELILKQDLKVLV